MIIHINAPQIRSLNPNEKMVYKLLAEGKTPKEIAHIMRINHKVPFMRINHKVPYDAEGETPKEIAHIMRINHKAPYDYEWQLDTMPALSVQEIITSIREKGWELPAKEEKDVNNYGPEIKKDAIKLHTEGVPTNEIAKRLSVPYKTVWKWVHEYDKKEPAPVATDTSSKQIFHKPIIPQKPENVKHCFSSAMLDAAQKAIIEQSNELQRITVQQKKYQEQIDALRAKISALDDLYTYAAAELDRLRGDYDFMVGGSEHE